MEANGFFALLDVQTPIEIRHGISRKSDGAQPISVPGDRQSVSRVREKRQDSFASRTLCYVKRLIGVKSKGLSST